MLLTGLPRKLLFTFAQEPKNTAVPHSFPLSDLLVSPWIK